MATKVMVLSSDASEDIRVIKVPQEYEDHEAYRHVVGLIARVQEENADAGWEEINEILEEHGFTPVHFVLGPAWNG